MEKMRSWGLQFVWTVTGELGRPLFGKSLGRAPGEPLRVVIGGVSISSFGRVNRAGRKGSVLTGPTGPM